MTVALFKDFIFWSMIVNIGILLFSAVIILVARRFIAKIHSKWFGLSEQNILSNIYLSLAFYKILIVIFNVVPYIALSIIM